MAGKNKGSRNKKKQDPKVVPVSLNVARPDLKLLQVVQSEKKQKVAQKKVASDPSGEAKSEAKSEVKRNDFRIALPNYNVEVNSKFTRAHHFPKNKLPFKLEMPGNLSEKHKEYLRGYWDIDSVAPYGECNHPFMAVTRSIAEAMAIQQCIAHCASDDVHGGVILDAGGNSLRHKLHERKYIHSCNPDATKIGRNHNGCTFTAAKCLTTCFKPYEVGPENYVQQPTITMSSHAWYYFSDEEKASLVYDNDMRTHYAVIHNIPSVAEGKSVELFDGEMKVVGLAAGLVSCKAAGNAGYYNHKSTSDMFTTGGAVYNGKSVVWDIVAKFADQFLFKIQPGVAQQQPVLKIEDPVVPQRDMTNINGRKYDSELVDLATLWLTGVDRTKAVAEKLFPAQFPSFVERHGKKELLPSKHLSQAYADLFHYIGMELDIKRTVVNPTQIDDLKELEDLKAYKLPKVPLLSSIIQGVVAGSINYTIASTIYGKLRAMGYGLAAGILWAVIHLCYKAWKMNYTKPHHYLMLFRNLKPYSIFWALYRAKHPTKHYDIVKMGDVCSPDEIKPLDRDVEVYKEPPLKPCQSKRISQTIAAYSPMMLPIRARPCDHMTRTAFRNRVTFPLEPTKSWFQIPRPKFLQQVIDYVKSHPLDYDRKTWMSRWSAKKQVEEERKYERVILKNDRDNPSQRGGFGKDEFVLGKDTFSWRMIQTCSPQFCAEVGPWMQAMSSRVTQIANADSPWFYASKTSSEITGQWFQKRLHKKLYDSDFSKFDGTRSHTSMCWANNVYRDMGAPEEAMKMLDGQVDTDLVMRGGWRAKLPGRFGSGRPDTSISNSFENFAATVDAILHSSDNKEEDIDIMDLGDDIVIAVEHEIDVDAYVSEMAKLGLKAKMARKQPHEVEFCSQVFVPTADGYIMTPKPGKVLAKTFFEKKNLPIDQLCEWTGSVALGMRDSVNHMPVLGPFINRLIREFRPKTVLEREDHKIYAEKSHEPDQSTYEWFCLHYGVTMEEIQAMERQVCNGPLPVVLEGLSWQKIFQVDVGGDFYAHLDKLQVNQHCAKRNENPSMVWRVLIGISPVVEELIKHIAPPINLLASAVFAYYESDSLLSWLHRYTVHVGLGMLPLGSAVMTHSVVNALIDGSPCNFALAISKLVDAEMAKPKIVGRITNTTRTVGRITPRRVRAVVLSAKTRKRNRRRTRRTIGRVGGTMALGHRQYLLSQINPFLGECDGVRLPDSYAFPTATVTLRSATNVSGVSATGNYIGAAIMTPFPSDYLYSPASITAGGTITWNAGSVNTAAQFNTFTSIATQFRVVSWGVRITCETPLSSTGGHIIVGHLPQDLAADKVGFTQMATTEASALASPLAEKYSLTELSERPLVIVGRRVDDGSLRFRDSYYPANGSAYAETSTGWALIYMYMNGGTTVPSVNVEWIAQIEYQPDLDNASYGFGAVAPQPPNLALYEKGVLLQMTQPTAHIEPVGAGVDTDSMLSNALKMASNVGQAFLNSNMAASMGSALVDRVFGSRRVAPTSFLRAERLAQIEG